MAATNVIVLAASRDRSFRQGRWMTIPDVINASGSLPLYCGNKMVWGPLAQARAWRHAR